MEIRIDYELQNYLLTLNFQDKSYFRLLKFLTSQEDTLPEWIDYYTKKYDENYKELQILEQEIADMYCPEGYDSTKFQICCHKGLIKYNGILG